VNEAHEINIAERAREEYKAELGSLVPFSDLQILADYIADKTGKHVQVAINYDFYTVGPETTYRLYVADTYNKHFNTVQELQQAMERILNPPVDQGVLLDTEAK